MISHDIKTVSEQRSAGHIWSRIKLGEILTKSDEWVTIKPDERYRQVTVRLWGKGVTLRAEVSGAEIASARQLVVHRDQFILSRIDARNGAFGLIPDTLDGAVVSNDFPAFVLDTSRIMPAFLTWMSRTSRFVELCKAASEGTTNRVRLQEGRFLATEISLPPLEEQKRIVVRIDELANKIEEARGLRRETMKDVEKLEGAASRLIFDPQRYINLPTRALGEVAEIRSGVTLGRTLYGETISVPYLRVANVQDGYLDLDIIKEVSILTDELDKWRLEPGDILLTEGGDWDKLGRGTVWCGEIPLCIHQNHIFRVRTNPSQFDPDYLAAFIGSPYGKEYFQAASKQTTNLASINQTQLKAFKVFCLPIDEQRSIVGYLNNIRSQISKLKQLQLETSAELDALLPSILNKAFRGEL